jgi:hypothetical protein
MACSCSNFSFVSDSWHLLLLSSNGKVKMMYWSWIYLTQDPATFIAPANKNITAINFIIVVGYHGLPFKNHAPAHAGAYAITN